MRTYLVKAWVSLEDTADLKAFVVNDETAAKARQRVCEYYERNWRCSEEVQIRSVEIVGLQKVVEVQT